MRNASLTAAVERLLCDHRFRSRFQRDPEGVLARFGLSPTEVAALREGDSETLLQLGLDPSIIWPEPGRSTPLEPWLLRNAKRLAPAVFLAALLAAWPATAAAGGGGIPNGNPGKPVACQHVTNPTARNVMTCTTTTP